jgi:transposase
MQQTLDDWIDLAGASAGKLLRSLRDKALQWWYFLDNPEVPPDNNQVERSLRLAVSYLAPGNSNVNSMTKC